MRKGNLHLSTGFSMLYYTFFGTKVGDRQKLVFIQLKFWKKIAMKNSYHILLHLTPCAEKFCKTICVEVVRLVLRRRADRQTDARQDTKKTPSGSSHTRCCSYLFYTYTQKNSQRKERNTFLCRVDQLLLARRKQLNEHTIFTHSPVQVSVAYQTTVSKT